MQTLYDANARLVFGLVHHSNWSTIQSVVALVRTSTYQSARATGGRGMLGESAAGYGARDYRSLTCVRVHVFDQLMAEPGLTCVQCSKSWT